MELVGREREHTNLVPLHVDIQMTHGLDRVGMEGNPLLPAYRADLRNGLDGAHLVVGIHDGDQGGILPDGGGHVLGLHQTGVPTSSSVTSKPSRSSFLRVWSTA